MLIRNAELKWLEVIDPSHNSTQYKLLSFQIQEIWKVFCPASGNILTAAQTPYGRVANYALNINVVTGENLLIQVFLNGSPGAIQREALGPDL